MVIRYLLLPPLYSPFFSRLAYAAAALCPLVRCDQLTEVTLGRLSTPDKNIGNIAATHATNR